MPLSEESLIISVKSGKISIESLKKLTRMQELMADLFLFRLFIVFLTSLDITSLKENYFGMKLFLILEMMLWFSSKGIISENKIDILRVISLIVKYH